MTQEERMRVRMKLIEGEVESKKVGGERVKARFNGKAADQPELFHAG